MAGHTTCSEGCVRFIRMFVFDVVVEGALTFLRCGGAAVHLAERKQTAFVWRVEWACR